MGNIAAHAPFAMFSGILDRHLAARFLSNAGAIMAREPLLAPFPGTVPPPLEMPSDSMMAREPSLATDTRFLTPPHFKWFAPFGPGTGSPLAILAAPVP